MSPPPTTTQPCHAQRCTTEIPAEAYMCPDHWRLVPAPMRTILTAGLSAAGPPTAEWTAIAQAAVAEVAHRETRTATVRGASVRRRPARKAVQLALFELPATS